MTPKEAIKAKIAIYDELVRDPRARAVDLRVAWLLLFKYLNSESGLAWPSASTMATETSISVRAVRRSIGWLTGSGGYFTKTKGGGRGHSNQYSPNLERVTAESPINGERVTSLAVKGDTAGRKRVTLVSPDSLEESKEESLEDRASLASPPEGGSRSALSKPRKQDSRQGSGERLDDGEPPVTPEEVRKIMRGFRASLKATEEGEETTSMPSAKSAERLARQEANWQREVAAVAQHAARRGNGKWKQGAAEHSLEHVNG